MTAARRWYREPLLHFVVVGVLLAWLRSALHQSVEEPIVLTTALDEALANEHRLARGVPASDDELDAARLRWTREEALYREALALGLDEGDAIVRRRLIQKMTFVIEAALEVPEVDDAAAAAYLEAHASELELVERRSLEHRYFVDERLGPTPIAAAGIARADLLAGRDVPGDPFLAADGFSSISEAELSRVLGEASADAVFALEPGVWSEPIAVGRGALLVRVLDVAPAHAPTLGSVRSRIDAAVIEAHREVARDAAIADVLARYRVVRE
jgi:hypothetical protein